MSTQLLHSETTDKILGAFYRVHTKLGAGFLEKVYHNALHIEFRRIGLPYTSLQELEVWYEGIQVGVFYPDFIINNVVIVEIKAAEQIHPDHISQLTNYLSASEVEVGLLLNFGAHAEFKRRICSNKQVIAEN